MMRGLRARKFRLIIRRALAGAATLALLLSPGMASAIEAGSDKTVNCDDNAVLYCGALSTDNLIHKYNSATGDGLNSRQSIHDIYGYSKFGITSTDVNALDSTAVAGTVTREGNVFLASDTNNAVATGAITAGRLNMPGSTKVTSGSTTFYTRTPNISFTKETLDAFVVMKGGVFQFAILSSCGNPVAAKPVQPKPKPQSQPAPTPTPAPQTPTTTTNTNVNINNNTNAVFVSTSVPAQPAAQETKQLPATGAGSVAGIFAASSAAGTIAYRWFLRRRLS
jgi:hypothetical protein